MRRFLTGIGLVALLLLSAVAAGCGGKGEGEETPRRPRKAAEVRASDLGSLAEAE